MEQPSAGEDKTSASLARELNHRVRNMLQIVMGLCNQTLRQSADLRQFENLFLGRVQALARVYEVVQRDGWTQVSVHELIDSIVSRVIAVDHYQLEGDKAQLAADGAMGFGLVIHEIAEGARQRGVAAQGGNLRVRWDVNREDDAITLLTVHWQEHASTDRDVPIAVSLYERLERQLRHELNGRLCYESAPGSLYIKLELPLAQSQAMH